MLKKPLTEPEPTQVEKSNELEPTTSSNLHQSVPSIESNYHDYAQSSCLTNLKRTLEFKPSRRVRSHQGDKLSKRLANLSEETLGTLQNIEKNSESIAECLKVIASVMKDSVQ